MAGPNLAAARRAFESLMTDTCRITVGQSDPPPGDVDLQTGMLPAPADPVTVYGPGVGDLLGRCQFSPDRQANRLQRAAEERRVARYTLSLPATAPVPPDGAVVECLTSAWDPELPGLLFVVDGEPDRSSLLLKRRVRVKREVPAPELAQ